MVGFATHAKFGLLGLWSFIVLNLARGHGTIIRQLKAVKDWMLMNRTREWSKGLRNVRTTFQCNTWPIGGSKVCELKLISWDKYPPVQVKRCLCAECPETLREKVSRVRLKVTVDPYQASILQHHSLQHHFFDKSGIHNRLFTRYLVRSKWSTGHPSSFAVIGQEPENPPDVPFVVLKIDRSTSSRF